MRKLVLLFFALTVFYNEGLSTVYYACGTGITWDGSTSFVYTASDCSSVAVNPNTLTSADEMVIQAGAVITVVGIVTLNAIKLTVFGTLYIHTPAIAGKLNMPENSAIILFEVGSTLGCTDDGTTSASCGPASGSQIRVGTGGSKYIYKGSEIDDVDDLPKPSFLDNTGGSLPVDLIFFTVTTVEKAIILNWATASEENFNHFVIEKSSDAEEFYSIGKLTSKGDEGQFTEYYFFDEAPLKGLNYYRLKAVDWDGTFVNHAIISIRFEGDFKEDILVYPNPITDNHITIRSNFDFEFAKVRIIDVQGNEYLNSIQYYPSFGYQLPNNLGKGVYFVEFNTGFRTINKIIIKY